MRTLPVAVAGCLLAAAPAVGQVPGWTPDPKQQAELAAKNAPWVFREGQVPAYTLPDPLRLADGTRVTDAAGWEKRGRPATLELFRTHVYGKAPAGLLTTSEVTATNPTALGGTATLKRLRITSTDAAGKRFAFAAAVLVPNGAKGPVPAFVLINHRPVAAADPTRAARDDYWPAEQIVARGYAAAVFQAGDVDPDDAAEAARTSGVRGVWPAGGGTPGHDAWGTLAAWAWGAGRVLDALRTDPAIDGSRVGVVGHSRGGKAALWAAAEHPGFALGVANNSGRGGASLTRRGFGEPWPRITRAFPHWFCGNYARAAAGPADGVPVDQHQLVGLLAPRAAYVASAAADLWADPRGEFLSLVHAGPVYALYGQPAPAAGDLPAVDVPLARGRVGYHVRPGGHALTPADWGRFLDFADRPAH